MTRFNSEGGKKRSYSSKDIMWGQSLKRKEMSYSHLGRGESSNEENTQYTILREKN
jgi:hypothetical protein